MKIVWALILAVLSGGCDCKASSSTDGLQPSVCTQSSASLEEVATLEKTIDHIAEDVKPEHIFPRSYGRP